MYRIILTFVFLIMSSVTFGTQTTTVETTTNSTSDVNSDSRTIVISPPPSDDIPFSWFFII